MKVIADFKDKFTKKVYRKDREGKKGDTYTHEDEKRIAFLVEKGYLEGDKPKKETTKEKPKK